MSEYVKVKKGYIEDILFFLLNPDFCKFADPKDKIIEKAILEIEIDLAANNKDKT